MHQELCAPHHSIRLAAGSTMQQVDAKKSTRLSKLPPYLHVTVERQAFRVFVAFMHSEVRNMGLGSRRAVGCGVQCLSI